MFVSRKRRRVSKVRNVSRKRVARRSLWRRSKRFKAGRRMRPSRGMNFGVGSERIVKERYYAHTTFTVPYNTAALTVGPSSSIIKLNDAQDPSFAASGTFNLYPAGYKLWGNLFNYYTVLGAKVVYTLRNCNAASATTSGPGVRNLGFKWGVKLDDDSSIAGFTNWAQLSSDSNCRTKTFLFQRGYNNSSTIVVKYSPRRFFGIKDTRDEDTIGASTGATPTRLCYAIPWIQSLDPSGGIINSDADILASLEIKLYMTVLFKKPKDISTLASADALIES